MLELLLYYTQFILNSLLATYEVMVPEDLSGGGSILQVTATDEDSGKNSKLTYSIVDTTILPNSLLDDVDPSVSHTVCDSYQFYFFRFFFQAVNTTSLFNITSSDGTLFLSAGRNLDRETVTGYSVQVRAVDGGVPAQSGCVEHCLLLCVRVSQTLFSLIPQNHIYSCVGDGCK